MQIRLAQENDVEAIQTVYQEYIDTTVTFDYELPTIEESLSKLKNISKDYPYIVAEESGKIIGFAYAHRFMERYAYQWGAELTVYVSRTAVSKGIGKSMYCTLIDILQLLGIRTVYGCVTIPNKNSERLHESLGFKRNAYFSNAGYKLGMWRDMAWFEKQINTYQDESAPIKSIGEIGDVTIYDILKRYNEND
ncbi:MAG: GNAT family N-acetyltransferase [Suipraeoptans sp.]